MALPEGANNQTIVPPKYIGNVRCFWHNEEGIPRITIGPNWCFSILLFLIVGCVLYTSTVSLANMIKRGAAWYWILLGIFLIIFGLFCFFKTLLGDPGIPKEVYEHYARPYLCKPALPATDEKGFNLCKECSVVYLIPEREHCDLCNVCVDDPDHHCVFFTKCIARHNVAYFRLAIVMFVLNMTYFVVIYGLIILRPKSNAHHAVKHL